MAAMKHDPKLQSPAAWAYQARPNGFSTSGQGPGHCLGQLGKNHKYDQEHCDMAILSSKTHWAGMANHAQQLLGYMLQWLPVQSQISEQHMPGHTSFLAHGSGSCSMSLGVAHSGHLAATGPPPTQHSIANPPVGQGQCHLQGQGQGHRQCHVQGQGLG